jgi:octaprenyl-diphosphate synthase
MKTATRPLSDLFAPIQLDLEVSERLFHQELSSDLAFVNELCDVVRNYRGKMLRPALLLLSAKAAGPAGRSGDLGVEHHTLAAVVEIVHMATLVHDDVLDEADERRRHPTIRALSGNSAAVLLGDYLISHAFHLCSSLADPYASRRIGATTNTVCEGELLQNHWRGRRNVSEDAYLDIIRRKTAALIATCAELGAYYSNAAPSIVRALRAFGESIGIAFQIVDDCLDLIGDAAVVGKSLGRDAATGTLTLPTIHCLTGNDGVLASELWDMVSGRVAPDGRKLHGWLTAAGSIDYSLNVAEGHVADARRQIEFLPAGDAKASLQAMADFVIQRAY